MKIKVTQEHILKGRRNSCLNCPIALAMKEAGYSGVRITHHTVTFASGKEPVKKVLPPIAQEFIKDYDALRITTPFEFEL